jgi:hypothetical protein
MNKKQKTLILLISEIENNLNLMKELLLDPSLVLQADLELVMVADIIVTKTNILRDSI